MRRAALGAAAVYERCLVSHPLATKSATSGVIAVSGDAVAQKCIERDANREFDWARAGRFAVFGSCLLGPTLHVWYGALHRAIPGNALKATVVKIACDQLIFSPPFLAGAFSFLGLLERKPLPDIKTQLSEIWAPSVVRNWLVWVPVQALNFGVIPVRYQVMVSNIAGVLWNSYLSWVTQVEEQQK